MRFSEDQIFHWVVVGGFWKHAGWELGCGEQAGLCSESASEHPKGGFFKICSAFGQKVMPLMQGRDPLLPGWVKVQSSQVPTAPV